MAASRRPSLNVFRGLAGAVLGAVAAAALTVALSAGFLHSRWVVTGAGEFDRAYDLRDAQERLPFALLGCAAVGAGAGWATWAPSGRYRFAPSLAVVALATVPLWWAVWSLPLTPRRYKSEVHPAVYPSEALVVIGPPVAVAAVLARVRARRGAAPVPNKSLQQTGGA